MRIAILLVAILVSSGMGALVGHLDESPQALPAAVDTLDAPEWISDARFIENVGQHPDEVHFSASTSGQALFITAEGFVVSQQVDGGIQHSRVTFVDAQTKDVRGQAQRDAVTQYWLGDLDARASEFGEVFMEGVYEGIDVNFYGNGDYVEFDFIVHPGANPAHIQMHAPGVKLDGGDLLLPGDVRINAPYAFQMDEVPSAFVLDNDVVTFALAPYNPELPLIIDPLVEQISFWGGSQEDYLVEIIQLDNGDFLFLGNTNSIDFPLSPDAFEETKDDLDFDYFLTHMTKDRFIVFSAFVGGTEEDLATDMFVDGKGNVYVTGSTRSDTYPVRDAHQGQRASQNGNTDAFFTRIAAGYSAIDISSFLGGGTAKAGIIHNDVGVGIASDDLGNMYVLGHTFSADFPITNDAMQPNFGRSEDLFLTKYDGNGVMVTSTYVFGDLQNPPGGGKEIALQLELHGDTLWGMAMGNVADLPTTADAVQATKLPGGNAERDGVLFAIDTDLETLSHVTYFGGTGDDEPSEFVFREDKIWVVGSSDSQDLFTHDEAYFNVPASRGWNAFILSWEPGVPDYELGTYYGGSERANEMRVDNAIPGRFDHSPPAPLGAATTAPAENRGYGIAFDERNNVAITGTTDAYEMWNQLGWHYRSLPILRPFDDPNIRFANDVDGFIAVLTPTLDDIHLSSHFGGTVLEEGVGTHGIDVLSELIIDGSTYYIAGITNSELNLPFTDDHLDPIIPPADAGMPERIGWNIGHYFEAADMSWLGAGAPGNDVMGVDAGAVYTYDINVPTAGTLPPPNVWRQHEFVTVSELEAGDQFGTSLTMSNIGTWDPTQGAPDVRVKMVVGAPGDDDVAQDAGAAYLFWYNSDSSVDSWLTPDPNAYPNGDEPPYQKFTAPDGQAGDGFGTVVGSQQDDIIAIAAPYADVTVGGIELKDAGAVYLYTLNPLTQMFETTGATYSPNPVANGRFGSSINFGQSSTFYAIGEPGGDGATPGSGAVHVFLGPDVQTLFDPNGNRGDEFGHSLRLHANAKDSSLPRLVVGAPHDDQFGRSSGAVFMFDADDAFQFQFTQELHQSYAEAGDLFGYSVDFDDRASELFIGAPGDNDDGPNSGAAYFFDGGATPWDQRNKMKAPFPEAGDGFGHDVNFWDYGAISMPGSDRMGSNRGAVLLNQNLHPTIVNPAPDRSWSWGLPGPFGWYNEATFIPEEHQPNQDADPTPSHLFGWSTGIDDDIAVMGAPMQDTTINVDGQPIPTGAAYALRRNGNLWGEQTTFYASDKGNGDQFGYAVDVSGGHIVVTAPFNADAGTGSGSAYVFDYDPITRKWVETAKLVASNAAVGDNFGLSVSIHNDRIAIGAPGQAGDEGLVYIFDLIDGTWVETAILVPEDEPGAGAQYGFSVAVWDDSLFVGALGDAVDEDDVDGGPGGIYVYRETPLGWVQESNDLGAGGFGYSLDIWDDKVIIGQPYASSVTFYMNDGAEWIQDGDPVVVGDPDNVIGQPGDRAGWDVAIHETTALVGKPLEETDLPGSSEGCTDCGTVSVLGREWGVWMDNTPVEPAEGIQSVAITGADAEHYGWSVALSDNHALIGSPHRSIFAGTDAGLANLATAIGVWDAEFHEPQEDTNARRGSYDVYFARLRFIEPHAAFDFEQQPVVIEGGAPVFACDNSPVQFTDLSLSSGAIDFNERPFEWAWDFGDGVTSTLQNPIHTFPSIGTYPVTLDVAFYDGVHTGVDVRTVTEQVTVVQNQPAVVDASADPSWQELSEVQLIGTINDPEGRDVDFEWTQLTGPEVELQAFNGMLSPTFEAPDVGKDGAELTFRLTAYDGCETTFDDVTVTITHINNPPIADAGGNRISPPGQVLFLDGSASYDPDGDDIAFLWEQTDGVSVDLFDTETSSPSFYVPTSPTNDVLTLAFLLTVSDSELTSTETVTVSVSNDGQEGSASSGGTGGAGGTGGSGGGNTYFDQTCVLYPSLCPTVGGPVDCTTQPEHVDCQEEEEAPEEGGETDEGQSESDPDALNRVIYAPPKTTSEGPSVPWIVMLGVLAFAVLFVAGFVLMRMKLKAN